MHFFRCAEEIATVRQQYPAEQFKYLDPRYMYIQFVNLEHTLFHAFVRISNFGSYGNTVMED